MSNQSIDENDMPAEIDFSQGKRGVHHFSPGATVLMPAGQQGKKKKQGRAHQQMQRGCLDCDGSQDVERCWLVPEMGAREHSCSPATWAAGPSWSSPLPASTRPT